MEVPTPKQNECEEEERMQMTRDEPVVCDAARLLIAVAAVVMKGHCPLFEKCPGRRQCQVAVLTMPLPRQRK